MVAGTEGLFAGAAIVDLASLRANSSTSYNIGTGGAVITPLDSFATPLPVDSTAIQLRFTHQPDASLLMDCGFSSAAVVPGAASSRRRSLLAAPQVTGALSTTVVSGEVSVTSSPGGSGAVDVALPLTADYTPGQVRQAVGRMLRFATSGPRAANRPPLCHLTLSLSLCDRPFAAVDHVLAAGRRGHLAVRRHQLDIC